MMGLDVDELWIKLIVVAVGLQEGARNDWVWVIFQKRKIKKKASMASGQRLFIYFRPSRGKRWSKRALPSQTARATFTDPLLFLAVYGP